MMKKLLKLKFGRKAINVMKKNKILTFASILFITFSGINLFLVYAFVQVLEKI